MVTSPTASAPRDPSALTARVVRAVDAFRRGAPVIITSGRDRIEAVAVETVRQADLDRLAAPVAQLLTHARAKTLKIRLYTPDVVAIAPDLPLDRAKLLAIADPTFDLATPIKGPFETHREPVSPADSDAIKLAKLAGLLPSVLLMAPAKAPRGTVRLSASDIAAYETAALHSLAIVTRARVPLEDAEHSELIAFRAHDGAPEHYAILIGDPPRNAPVLTRLHSECFTGDLLGSLKCDCGPQLRGAIATIAAAGGGVVLYLAQEGRGIGLVNKLRAYALQDQGFDTLDANLRLGFGADERLYGVAARMLELLGFRAVRLMTNNPDKVQSLASAGIDVVERVPHAFPENIHNRAYLETKAKRAGHLL
jgi:GTP cyclohydrolase II